MIAKEDGVVVAPVNRELPDFAGGEEILVVTENDYNLGIHMARQMIESAACAGGLKGTKEIPTERYAALTLQVINFLFGIDPRMTCSPFFCMKICANGDCDMENCFTACMGRTGHPCC